jgi:Fuc2NAc and GlcNAc transferase
MIIVAGLILLIISLSYLAIGGLLRWIAHRQIMLDIPNERSSHARPIPRGGGLVIAAIALGGLMVAWLLNPSWPLPVLLALLAGAALIVVIGCLDDVHSLSNRLRFATHGLAAFLIILGCGYWRFVNVPFLGQLYLGWLGLPLTFLWIVGLINAYNFMDGIDGIAGGQAVVAGLGWAILGWLCGQLLPSILGLLIAAASIGFMGHNWSPARIFMGDVGSTFLGYTFAVLPIVTAQSDSKFTLAGALLVWPFIFDAAFTFVRRLCRGEKIYSAHRSHLYQRLVIAGYSHRFVTLLYISLAAAGVILALIWLQYSENNSIAVALGMALLCPALLALAFRQEHKRAGL